jgi:hypothetical protein
VHERHAVDERENQWAGPGTEQLGQEAVEQDEGESEADHHDRRGSTEVEREEVQENPVGQPVSGGEVPERRLAEIGERQLRQLGLSEVLDVVP